MKLSRLLSLQMQAEMYKSHPRTGMNTAAKAGDMVCILRGGVEENLRHQPGWGGGFRCNKIKLHVTKIGSHFEKCNKNKPVCNKIRGVF